jgi:hypothetical protein
VFLTDTTVSGNVTGTASLVGGGQVVQFKPSANLPANHSFQLTAQNLTNLDGVAAQNFSPFFTFSTGIAADSTAPTVVSVGPPDNSTGVGTNALAIVTFSKFINPISVAGATIKITGGGQTEVPSSIIFDSTGTVVTIAPQAPLPANTQITIAISGVTDQENNAVVAKTTHFTTGPGPDTSAPQFAQTNVQNGETVPTNFAFSVQFNKPMDTATVNIGTFGLYDATLAHYVAGTISVSTDLTTATFVPSAPLTPGDNIYPLSYGAWDLSGNPQQSILCGGLGCFNLGLTVGSVADTTPPQVTQTSPGNSVSGVGINALVQVEFSKVISPTSIGQINLFQGGTPISVTRTLSNMNQAVTLTPAVPLSASTIYTISITGVKDFVGNTLVGTVTSTFTTGPGADFVAPNLLSTSPTDGASSIPTNTTIKLVFDKAMNPLTFDPVAGEITLVTTNTSTPVAFAVTFSADFKTATLTTTGLASATQYTLTVFGSGVADVSGNRIVPTNFVNFTTQ